MLWPCKSKSEIGSFGAAGRRPTRASRERRNDSAGCARTCERGRETNELFSQPIMYDTRMHRVSSSLSHLVEISVHLDLLLDQGEVLEESGVVTIGEGEEVLVNVRQRVKHFQDLRALHHLLT